MNNINPLYFPEHQDLVNKPKSEFPYNSPPIVNQPPVAAASGADRMKQLEQMLQEAQGRAEIIEKEAYDKAYLAGEKAGMALGKKRGEQILESLQETLQDAEQSIDDIKHGFAEAALDIAQHLAEAIIGNTLEKEHRQLWQIAQQAAAQLPDTSELRIAVSPDDLISFKRLLDESPSSTLLSSDDSVHCGTCRIISSQQDILIDPVAAVEGYMAQLRPDMLQESEVIVEQPVEETPQN